MFHIANNGIVTVNRGDSFEFPITLNVGNSIDRKEYILSPTDILYMGIMEPNQPFENALIRKKFTAQDLDQDDNINIRFWPEDTVCVLPGKYYYQVKLQTIDAATGKKDVETVIDKTLFYIQE
jgi:hypothetical protein